MNNCIIYISFSLVLDNSKKLREGMLHAICRFALFTWKAFSDGFTNDNLSNVTGVSIDLINRVDEKN